MGIARFDGWWRPFLPVYFLGVVFGMIGLLVACLSDWQAISNISDLIFPVGFPLVALVMLGCSRHISVSRRKVVVYSRFLFWQFNRAEYQSNKFDWVEVRPESYLDSASTENMVSMNSYGYEAWLEGPIDICIDSYMPGKLLTKQTESDLLDCAERAHRISKITGCKIRFTQSILNDSSGVLRKNGYI